MIKVIIWGTGKTTTLAMKYIKRDVEIIAFADSYADEDKEFLGKKVILPEKINEYEWDWLIICSIYKDEIIGQIKAYLDIDINKVLCWNEQEMLNHFTYRREQFHTKLEMCKKKIEDIRLIITGISYHNDGILDEAFSFPSINFAMRGQDIFYDYEIVKYMCEKYEMNHLQYAIIGLCYYSFEYDLSKSNNGWEIIRYFPELETGHNLIEKKYWEQYCRTQIEKQNKLNGLDKVFAIEYEYALDYEDGEKTAKADYNKNYPITVFENKKILKEYIEYLEIKGIKPIIVIMPVTKYYSKFCNMKMKKAFYENLHEVIGEKEIQILDYFDKCDYPDEYWYHVNHMNRKGAEVFTKKLESDINW